MIFTQANKYFPFWEDLTDKQKESFLQSIQEVHMQKEDLMISSQTQCKGILLVKTGQLRVYILSESGREVTLFTMKPGELCVLSASCLLDGFTFPLHISSIEDSTVYSINQSYFGALVEENIYVENFMYKVAISRFSQVMWIIEDILFTRMDRRLAQQLLWDSQNSSTLKVTHEVLAKKLGTAREVISRMLKYFVQEGWISQKRGQIKILNRSALESL